MPFLDRPVKKVCAFLGADLDKGCFSGLGADDTPVPAGEISLPRDLHLAPAAV